MATLGAIFSVNLYSWPYKIFGLQYHIKSTKYGKGICSFATNMHKFDFYYKGVTYFLGTTPLSDPLKILKFQNFQSDPTCTHITLCF